MSTSSLAEVFGLSIEPSRLTEKQRTRLNSEDYYFEVSKSIGTGKKVLIQVDRRSYHQNSKHSIKDSQS